jgi:hypothetical protein
LFHVRPSSEIAIFRAQAFPNRAPNPHCLAISKAEFRLGPGTNRENSCDRCDRKKYCFQRRIRVQTLRALMTSSILKLFSEGLFLPGSKNTFWSVNLANKTPEPPLGRMVRPREAAAQRGIFCSNTDQLSAGFLKNSKGCGNR